MQILSLLFSIICLVSGAGLAWFFNSRSLSELRLRCAGSESRTREAEDRAQQLQVELATERARASRVDFVEIELSVIRDERDALQMTRAALEARAEAAATTHGEQVTRINDLVEELIAIRAERDTLKVSSAANENQNEHFEEQKRLLLAAKESLQKEFEAAGNKVLENAQEAFLKRAQDRFSESEKTSAERLRSLLEPVGQRLKSYEDQVSALEAKRADAFGQLTGLIESMRVGQDQVRSAAEQLGSSLRNAPKARGRWGERQLRNVLEQCGLNEHTDFVTEYSIETPDGRLRPDAIIKIPGRKQLIIDAKASLNDYQNAFAAEDEGARIRCLEAHAKSMRAHVQILASKNYQSQFDDAPDYVLMFVPGEHFIAAALDHDHGLWDFAFERRVLLVSPTNLVAIARTISQVWHQAGLEKEAREIGKLATDLYDSLAKTQDDLAKVGTHMTRAVNSFNDFARTYDGNVLSRARRLTEKHVQILKREIVEDVPLIESAPRYGDADQVPLTLVAE